MDGLGDVVIAEPFDVRRALMSVNTDEIVNVDELELDTDMPVSDGVD